jgi:hypothetical protein
MLDDRKLYAGGWREALPPIIRDETGKPSGWGLEGPVVDWMGRRSEAFGRMTQGRGKPQGYASKIKP